MKKIIFVLFCIMAFTLHCGGSGLPTDGEGGNLPTGEINLEEPGSGGNNIGASETGNPSGSSTALSTCSLGSSPKAAVFAGIGATNNDYEEPVDPAPSCFLEVPENLPVVYVGPTSQFDTIKEALVSLGGTPAKIYVAVGEYEGDFDVPSGTQLYGGFDPATWEKSDSKVSVIKNMTGSIFVLGGSNISVIDGFIIEGVILPEQSEILIDILTEFPPPPATFSYFATLVLRLDSKIVISNNTISSGAIVDSNGDYDSTATFNIKKSKLCLIKNKVLRVTGMAEEEFASIKIEGGRSFVADNQMSSISLDSWVTAWSWEAPYFYDEINEDTLIIKNQLSRRISINGASPVIMGNEISIKESETGGCDSAIYVSGYFPEMIPIRPDWKLFIILHLESGQGESHPHIRNNIITLVGKRTSGITFGLAGNDGSNPASIVGNHFRYTDECTPMVTIPVGNKVPPERYFSLEKVNSLEDIPEVGGNTIEYIGEE